jgi:hypothetical protein
MSDGGKGSKPRPFSVSQEEYDKRWDTIFSRDGLDDEKKKMPMPGTIGGAKVVFKDDYQDVLSTEDCVLNALDNLKK